MAAPDPEEPIEVIIDRPFIFFIRDIETGKIPAGSKVVCTLTGHGLKDPDTAIKQCEGDMLTVDAKLDAVKAAILNNMA